MGEDSKRDIQNLVSIFLCKLESFHPFLGDSWADSEVKNLRIQLQVEDTRNWEIRFKFWFFFFSTFDLKD